MGELDSALRQRFPLRAWLRADRGVSLGVGDVIERWETPADVAAAGLSFIPALGERGSAKVKQNALNGRAVAIFPAKNCALVAQGAQLAAPATLFVLLAPRAVTNGASALGQRIFGHYPDGQVRILDGKASFWSGGPARAAQGDATLTPMHWTLLAYRFPSAAEAELSVDGGDFAPLVRANGAALGAAFSANGFVTLGGVDGKCGFSGAIAELLLFDGALRGGDVAAVARYLAKRWDMPRIAPRGASVGAGAASTNGAAAGAAAGAAGAGAAGAAAGAAPSAVIIVDSDDNSVLDWQPPPGVGSDASAEVWRAKTSEAKNTIASFAEGGAALRK